MRKYINKSKTLFYIYAIYYSGVTLIGVYVFSAETAGYGKYSAWLLFALMWPLAGYSFYLVMNSFPWVTFPGDSAVLLSKSKVYQGLYARLSASLCIAASLLLFVSPFYWCSRSLPQKEPVFDWQNLNQEILQTEEAIIEVEKKLRERAKRELNSENGDSLTIKKSE